jgi:hypothetical protein
MDKSKQNTTPPDDMPRSAEERVRLIASRLRNEAGNSVFENLYLDAWFFGARNPQ